MRNLAILLLFAFLLTMNNALSQKNCSFQIDTAKILSNENLDNFIEKLKTDSFKTTNNKKDIPEIVKKQLDCYTQEFRIANPDQPYNSTDVIVGNLPRRQLTFLAKSDSLFIMQYNRGGVGLSTHLLLVKYSDNKIIDLWKGICWQKIKSIQDIVTFLELNRNKEWGLNTNVIYF